MSGVSFCSVFSVMQRSFGVEYLFVEIKLGELITNRLGPFGYSWSNIRHNSQWSFRQRRNLCITMFISVSCQCEWSRPFVEGDLRYVFPLLYKYLLKFYFSKSTTI